jgi:prefoldin subunit 1
MVVIIIRFVGNDIASVTTKLGKESDEAKSDISNLEKKLHYLETTYKNSKEHMDRIFKTK